MKLLTFFLIALISISSQAEELSYNLAPKDIRDVLIEENQVTIFLSEEAKLELSNITKNNIGERLKQSVLGELVFSATIQTAINSGVIVITDPSLNLLAQLSDIKSSVQ